MHVKIYLISRNDFFSKLKVNPPDLLSYYRKLEVYFMEKIYRRKEISH